MTGKRLIVCLDGTWNSADRKGYASNVVKLMRTLAHRDEAGVDQVVFYDKGVGTGDWFDRLMGGLTGSGLDANVKDGYVFLGNNYEEGDEIYLFGFSRGAYTARSLAGFIGASGLLNRFRMGNLEDAWKLYCTKENQRPKDAKAKLGGRDVRIQAIGVWDTVGSLGVPLRWFNPFNFLKRRHEFHDTSLRAHVDCALHAIAVDEKRGPFAPTLWQKETRENLPEGQVVEQVWFPGTHGDVGGGLGEWGLSDLALEWMIRRLARHTRLVFRDDWPSIVKGNPAGVMHESRTAIYAVSRILPYERVIGGQDGWTRRFLPSRNEPDPKHEFVNEMIHPSVLQRRGKPAPVKDGRRKVNEIYHPPNIEAAVGRVSIAQV